MTWAKISTEFCDELAVDELSDAAVRTHLEALCWLYRVERHDVLIPKSLVRRFAGSPDYELAVVELVTRQYWHEHPAGYEVRHHSEVVRKSLAAQHSKKDRDAKAQRTQRNKRGRDAKKDEDTSGTDADVSADANADVSASPKQSNTQAVSLEQDHQEDRFCDGCGVDEGALSWPLSRGLCGDCCELMRETA